MTCFSFIFYLKFNSTYSNTENENKMEQTEMEDFKLTIYQRIKTLKSPLSQFIRLNNENGMNVRNFAPNNQQNGNLYNDSNSSSL